MVGQRRRLARLSEAQGRGALPGADRAPGPAPLTPTRHTARRRDRRRDSASLRRTAMRPARKAPHRGDAVRKVSGRTPAKARRPIRRHERRKIQMFKYHRKEIEWGGRKLVLETGSIARQADGAVLATYGETVGARAPPSATRTPKPGIDFFPLTVNYQEKTYRRRQDSRRLFQARGPADREGDADLAPDRPADPAAVRRRASATRRRSSCTVLSHDLENDPDIVAMVAASAALTISGIPFMGPIGGRARRLHRRRIRAQSADRRR